MKIQDNNEEKILDVNDFVETKCTKFNRSITTDGTQYNLYLLMGSEWELEGCTWKYDREDICVCVCGRVKEWNMNHSIYLSMNRGTCTHVYANNLQSNRTIVKSISLKSQT